MKTLLEHVYGHEQARPDRVWLTQPVGGGVLRDFTFGEALQEARCMAAYLRDRAYPPGSRIAILSKNTAWWFLADLAIWMAGHVSVPIYPTLTADSVRVILEHSGARLIFVGKLDHFAMMEPGIPAALERVAMPLATPGAGPEWDNIVAATAPMQESPRGDPDALATIMYTSGSTGTPKGVMHSFRTMDHSSNLVELAGMRADDRMVSYLPLSHVAERALLEATNFRVGFHVYFVESVDTFLQDVKRARPTLFGSVPRLWMQFQAGVFARIPARRLDVLLRVPVVSRLVRRGILRGLGLAHVRLAFFGSAPSPVELVAWYRSLGLELLEIYGMTENWAISHMGRVASLRPGWIGEPLPGVEHRVSNDGEVLVKSTGTMLGYYQSSQLTGEVIDADGWLHTGDRGEIDAAQRLRITGRVKELFKTSKGKYVAPAPIENLLLAHSAIEQACVAGAGMRQPFAMVVLSKAEQGAPRGLTEGTLSRLRESINATLDPHEYLETIVVIGEGWSVANGLLTPTMKLKRSEIEARYAPRVAAWYARGAPVVWAA